MYTSGNIFGSSRNNLHQRVSAYLFDCGNSRDRAFYSGNQVVISFLFVDFSVLFAFSYAFCGANSVARFGISGHGKRK